jgi:ankyrin repeat protein
MTRMLLEHGADPNLPEEGAPRGASLLIAGSDRQREIARMLLAHGADPNAEVDSSGTPMERSAGDHELLELLRRHGGQQRTSDRDRVGLLLEEGRLDEAERLLGANPEWIHDDEAGWGDGTLAGGRRSRDRCDRR